MYIENIQKFYEQNIYIIQKQFKKYELKKKTVEHFAYANTLIDIFHNI